mmetsp:Transcript_33986/g.102395  ORF Transcript_33986/g.102395 Transcript_33986/m.102395 type:complete len:230 (-) Transcript_33986:721-1410(-)
MSRAVHPGLKRDRAKPSSLKVDPAGTPSAAAASILRQTPPERARVRSHNATRVCCVDHQTPRLRGRRPRACRLKMSDDASRLAALNACPNCHTDIREHSTKNFPDDPSLSYSVTCDKCGCSTSVVSVLPPPPRTIDELIAAYRRGGARADLMREGWDLHESEEEMNLFEVTLLSPRDELNPSQETLIKIEPTNDYTIDVPELAFSFFGGGLKSSLFLGDTTKLSSPWMV